MILYENDMNCRLLLVLYATNHLFKDTYVHIEKGSNKVVIIVTIYVDIGHSKTVYMNHSLGFDIYLFIHSNFLY